jgi:hypothetical protein
MWYLDTPSEMAALPGKQSWARGDMLAAQGDLVQLAKLSETHR